MLRCTRKGCSREFSKESVETCLYHPGAPVFHEGLKSWSCCSDVNKPVLVFDEFMKISGCTQESGHTDEAPTVDPPKPSSAATNLVMSESSGEKEVYTTPSTNAIASVSVPAAAPRPIIDEEDNLDVPINPGTACRRNACGTLFVSDEVNRKGDGENTICVYHPAPPIFREGSKGYLCCKRRVLEFDEFLKIKGCKTGRHLFSPPATDTSTEEMTTCRIDHYQTLNQVHVSIFAKKVDQSRSVVEFDESQVNLDLYLPGKRFCRVLDLFGPIDPANSTFQYFGTKVELCLQKRDTRSWTVLEKTSQDLGGISLTFGVGGRTGTVGSKNIILDETNKIKARQL